MGYTRFLMISPILCPIVRMGFNSPDRFCWSGWVLIVPMGFRACAALAWIRLSSISSSDCIGGVVSMVGVSGSIERSAYEW